MCCRQFAARGLSVGFGPASAVIALVAFLYSPGEVYLNLARPDQVFEGARDKPGGALAFGSRGAGRIMAE